MRTTRLRSCTNWRSDARGAALNTPEPGALLALTTARASAVVRRRAGSPRFGKHSAQELGRAYDLASILVRYGSGDLVRRLGLATFLERAGRRLPRMRLEELAALTPAVRVRRALEEMGPTFVKLGQVLATRVDLFGPEWIEEFSKLQNGVPPSPSDDVLAQLREDLGADPVEVFATFDATPLAAASIAQVHRATLADGRAVVVKVRRPGIRPLVEADLRLLQRAARLAERRFPEWRQFQPVALVEQLESSLRDELDLAVECRHAERIAANLSTTSGIVVPKVHWQYTHERVNVQDYVEGIPIADIPALDAAALDRPALARRGADAVLRMMLHDGFFHADPHPGNVFALPDGRIALIDFGMVGRLSRERRAEVVALLQGLVTRDAEGVCDILLDWGTSHAADEVALTRDVDAFIDRYHGVPLEQLDLAGMLIQIAALLRTHGVVLPADLAMMIKVCLTLEGLGRMLDGHFDMASQAAPFLQREVRAQYAPRAIAQRSAESLATLAELLAHLPQDARRLLRSARAGRLRLQLNLDQLDRFGRHVDRSANRLTIGVVLAALVVGSSITMTVEGGPTLLGLPVFGLLGFVAAVLAGIWLVISIWFSGGGR